jgi:hypothetical protein
VHGGQPRQGGNNLAQRKALGRMAPTPIYSPFPAKRGRGKGERAAIRTHGCRRGRNYVTRHGGLTYDMNLGYRTLAQMRLVPKGQ